MFEGVFSYDGVERLGLWWGHPNVAACFLAMTYFVLVGVRKSVTGSSPCVRISRAVLNVAEVAAIGLLFLTYSRGGLVAVIAALLIDLVWSVAAQRNRPFRSYVFAQWMPCCLKIFVIATLFLASGFAGRFATIVTEGDRSALNRIEIFHGGARLIADHAPWGVGSGNSGYAFSNWYVPPGKEYRTATLISGVQTAVAEYGLPALIGIFGSICLLLAVPVAVLRREPGSLRAVATRYLSLVALSFVAANVFSCLYRDVWLLAACAAAVAGFFLAASRSLGRELRRILVASTFVGALCAAAVYAISAFAPNNHLRVAFSPDSAQLVPRTGSRSAPGTVPICVFPDREVLGYYYGAAIRRLVDRLGNREALCVAPDAALPRHITTANVLISFGNQWRRLQDERFAKATIWVVAPIGIPETWPPFDWLILPEIDVSLGAYRAWEEHARQTGAQIQRLHFVGSFLGAHDFQEFSAATGNEQSYDMQSDQR